MEIEELVWPGGVLAKIRRKHDLTREEVEEAFFESNYPLHIRRFGKLYYAYCRSLGGRYLFVVFLYLGHGRAQVVTARDMTQRERRLYRRETRRQEL